MTSFHFHREDDNEFLMAATAAADLSGPFIFHTLRNSYELKSIDLIPTTKDSAVYLGRMNQTNLGTTFVIHDYRVADESQKGRSIHELGLLLYERNVMGRQPNSMNVLIPRFDESATVHAQWASILERYSFQEQQKVLKRDNAPLVSVALPFGAKQVDSVKDFGGNVEYKAVEVEEAQELLRFVTKKPVWSDELAAWTLNFDGRVSMASKKNFMLTADETIETLVEEFGSQTTLLRFGKTEKHKFSLDYGYPFSPMTALGVVLSSFAKKMIVT